MLTLRKMTAIPQSVSLCINFKYANKASTIPDIDNSKVDSRRSLITEECIHFKAASNSESICSGSRPLFPSQIFLNKIN